MLRPNLYDYLKVLAIITMIIDHVGFLFFPEQELFRIVGRTAFPLFLFLVGYNHSYRWRNNLWIWGGILQLLLRGAGWGGFTDISYINILLAIAATRVLLSAIQAYKKLVLDILLFVVALLLAPHTYVYIDYGTLSIVFALLGYRSRLYGARWYIFALIAGAIGYHILFMLMTRSFSMQGTLLIIACILIGLLRAITVNNISLQSRSPIYDKSIITISTYALQIYVIQAIVLALLYGVSMFIYA